MTALRTGSASPFLRVGLDYYDANEAKALSEWPYYSLAMIDERPDFTPLIPTPPTNDLAARVDAPLNELLAGAGGGQMIHCVLVDSLDRIYIGGVFENLFGKKYLVRLNNDGTLDAGFNPSFASTDELNGAGVNRMALDEANNRLYITGPRLIAGGTHTGFACLDTIDALQSCINGQQA